MNDCMKIRTVFGDGYISSDTVTLSHEHICCYSEYLNMMSETYIDKKALAAEAAAVLSDLKMHFGLGLFIDCTPVNIGRDTELLKRVSERSEVDIVCSTGFYYTEEPILNCMNAEALANYIISDSKMNNAGIIKTAVEYERLSDYNVKLLRASAMAHKETGLPIVLHTNANNKNGLRALEILLAEGAAPECIAVGHLSDTLDNGYIKEIADCGCYVGLDRIYGGTDGDYINEKLKQITDLTECGYGERILLSCDDAVFQGFEANPHIKEPRWSCIFEHIAPRLKPDISERIIKKNPVSFLRGMTLY